MRSEDDLFFCDGMGRLHRGSSLYEARLPLFKLYEGKLLVCSMVETVS